MVKLNTKNFFTGVDSEVGFARITIFTRNVRDVHRLFY